MSIYATWLSIEDERQTKTQMEALGINYGVVDEEGEVEDLNDLDPDMLDAPIIYQGSHVLPSDNDPRGGSVDVAAIPNHISREGRDDDPEGALKDWLRLSVEGHRDADGEGVTADGNPYAVAVLTRRQVERLRDTLTAWLERESGG